MFNKKNNEDLEKRIQKLESELNLYKNIVENVPISVFAKDVQNNYNYIIWNRELEKVFGTPKSDILGINDFDLFSDKKEAEYFRNYDISVMNGNKIIDIPSENLTTKYGNKIVHTRKIPIYDENNQPKILLGCLEDITQKLETEQKLRESELKFREIVQQINDGIFVFNSKKEILIWNKGAENIFGINAEDVLYKNIADVQFVFAPPEFKDIDLINTIVDGIICFSNSEFFNRIFDNEIFVENNTKIKSIESKVFPIKLENENLFCTLVRDVTEKKENEKKLMKLNEDKDRFISILSHDLRSPFNSLLGFSNLLIQNFDKYDSTKIKNLLNAMNQSLSKTFNLIEDLLTWSISQSNKMPFNPEIVNFANICEDLESHFKEIVNTKNIVLLFDENNNFEFKADLNMFKAIFRNIISNAIKFTNRNGNIRVSAEKKLKEIIFSVLDDGIGIEFDTVQLLWNIEQKKTTEGTEGEKGTGLGLLICKEFVEKHNGKIWVESKLGKGSKFCFSIPNE